MSRFYIAILYVNLPNTIIEIKAAAQQLKQESYDLEDYENLLKRLKR